MFQSTTTQRRFKLALWAKGIVPSVVQATLSVCQSQTTSPFWGVLMDIPTYRPARSIRGSFRFEFVYVFSVPVLGS